jgi:anaerobic magnesium-protoporphyrin IX monomethyl ester cyclase
MSSTQKTVTKAAEAMNKKRNQLKIALVNPRVESYSSTMPPLGLLYIASVLERAGFTPRIFDIYPYDDRDFAALAEYRPDIVGMTILTDYWTRAVEVSVLVKARLPQSLFIVGGVHLTAIPEDTLAVLDATIGVIGEGETTMLELCQSVYSGEPWQNVAGIIFRDSSGNFERTSARPFIEELDSIPFPSRHLLNFEQYLVPPGIIRGHWTERSTTVMTSRGCPFSCIWCGSQCTFGRKVRNRSVENVVDEIQHLVNEYSIDTVWFVDDTFTLNKKRVLDFCRLMSERKISIVWGCQAHVKTADEEMFLAMKKVGLVQLDFGVESGSNRVLKSLKKDSTDDAIRRAFSIAHKTGLRTTATFMFGSPDETAEDVEKTMRLAQEIRPDFVSSFFITPYPGTELMALAEANQWEMSKREDSGLKKSPMLRINFRDYELLAIRKRFQRLFLWRNFSEILLSPRYLAKAFLLFLRNPGGIWSGARAFAVTRVFDDFVFAFLIYFVRKKMGKLPLRKG